MRIDTDRYIVCDNCGETEHFGNVPVRVADRLAKRGGWVNRKGLPLCQGCQEKAKSLPKTNPAWTLAATIHDKRSLEARGYSDSEIDDMTKEL